MGIYCPENLHIVEEQCVPIDAVKDPGTRILTTSICFLVTRGSGNITDDLTTLAITKYIQLNNQNKLPGFPIARMYFCNMDMGVEYVCFEYLDYWRSYKRTAFAIHIRDASGILISLVLSVTYVSTPPLSTACSIKYRNNVNTNTVNSNTVNSNTVKSSIFIPNSIQTSPQWEVIDMKKAATILKHFMCDIGDDELDPLLNVVKWETINCQIYTNVFTNNTNEQTNQGFGLFVNVILSYSMSAVSIVSLAPPLLYNARHVSKWPLPKRVLYNQILTLFLSHLVTVLGISANDIAIICKVAGALIHYLWLSMYCWTSICAWHMYTVFACRLKSMRLVDKQTVMVLYLRYRLFGYLCPFLLVSPAAILDLLQWKHIYGPNVCYVSDYETLLFLFMIPIAFSCFVNILAYFTTIYNIVLKTRNMSVLKYDCVFYTKLFVKMWFMLSLTSVSAITAVLINNTIAWYLFICMYGVQSIASTFLLGFHKEK